MDLFKYMPAGSTGGSYATANDSDYPINSEYDSPDFSLPEKPVPPEELEVYIQEAVQLHPNVRPELIRDGIIAQESSGNANALGSPTKYGRAKGLGQFIDSTAKEYIPGWTGPQDSLDPRKNVLGIAAYLDDLISQTGDERKAVGRYLGTGYDPVSGLDTETYADQVLAKAGGGGVSGGVGVSKSPDLDPFEFLMQLMEKGKRKGYSSQDEGYTLPERPTPLMPEVAPQEPLQGQAAVEPLPIAPQGQTPAPAPSPAVFGTFKEAYQPVADQNQPAKPPVNPNMVQMGGTPVPMPADRTSVRIPGNAAPANLIEPAPQENLPAAVAATPIGPEELPGERVPLTPEQQKAANRKWAEEQLKDVVPLPRQERKKGLLSPITESDIVESARRGKTGTALDLLTFDVIRGTQTWDDIKKLRDQFKKMNAKDPVEANTWVGRQINATAEMIPPMLEGQVEASAGGLAGSLIPGVGTAAGTVAGGMQYWFRQGAGNMYANLRDSGVDDGAARIGAIIGGVPYAAIEFSQVSKLIPGGRKVVQGIVAEASKKTLANMAKRYGKTWMEEVTEEMAQQMVQDVTEEVTKALTGNAKGTIKERVLNVLGDVANTFAQSAIPMLLVLGPKATVETAGVLREKAAPVKPGTTKPSVPPNMDIEAAQREAVEKGQVADLRGMVSQQEPKGNAPPTSEIDDAAKIADGQNLPSESNVNNVGNVSRETLGPPPVVPERRKDIERRKTIDEMTDEERRIALGTDEMTGLGSGRAHQDRVDLLKKEGKKTAYALIDADALKYVNDNMGHESGDNLLKHIAGALKEAGADAYRRSDKGDEFGIFGDDEKILDSQIKKAYTILKGKTIEAKLPDGTIVVHTKPGFSYGISESRDPDAAISAADYRLLANKEARAELGLRSERGREPPGLVKKTPQGNGDTSPKIESSVPQIPKTNEALIEEIVKTDDSEKRRNGLFQFFGGLTSDRLEELDNFESTYKDKEEEFWHGEAVDYLGSLDHAATQRDSEEIKSILETITRHYEEFKKSGEIRDLDGPAADPENINPDPTDGQKDAGNYKKEHYKFHGFDVSIENAKGMERKGKDDTGREWSNVMQADYGYLRGTKGNDWEPKKRNLDALDVFVNPGASEDTPIFVVNQINPNTGEFDEHKVMFGYNTKEEAKAAYLANYEKGWRGLGSIVQAPDRESFRKWATSGVLRNPVKPEDFEAVTDVTPPPKTPEPPPAPPSLDKDEIRRKYKEERERKRKEREEAERKKATKDSDYGLAEGSLALVDAMKTRLSSGESTDNPALTEMANKAFGGTRGEGKYTPRDAYDAVETAVNQHIESSDVVDFGDAAGTMQKLVELTNKLPTQADRTQEQTELQQFSTPPAEAFLVAYASGAKEGMTVLEPSAGNGALATMARKKGANVVTNELAPRRVGFLKLQGFRTHSVDAELLNSVLSEDVKPDVVVMNPPFSSTGGRVSKHNTQYGAMHVEQALARLNPGGRLVAIVGRGMAHDRPTFSAWWNKIEQKYNVRANLGIDGAQYGKYGTGFDNQILIIDKTGPTPGANRSERLGNIIRGTGMKLDQALKLIDPIAKEDVYGRIGETTGAGGETGGKGPGVPGSDSGDKPIRRPGGKPPSGRRGKPGETGGAGGSDRTGNEDMADVGGKRPGVPDEKGGGGLEPRRPPVPNDNGQREAGVPNGKSDVTGGKPGLSNLTSKLDAMRNLLNKGKGPQPGAAQGVAEMSDADIEDAAFDVVSEAVDAGMKDFKSMVAAIKELAGDLTENPTFRESIEDAYDAYQGSSGDIAARSGLSFSDAMQEKKEEPKEPPKEPPPPAPKPQKQGEEEGAYTQYVVKKATYPGSVPHPADIVESSALASVEPPDVHYKLDIPEEVITEGRASDVQLEAATYACQAHEQILPNGERKEFWIGDGTGLGKTREMLLTAMDNYRRGRKKIVLCSISVNLVTQLKKDMAALGFNIPLLIHGQTKLNAEIPDSEEGILFTTYSLLRDDFNGSRRRFNQVLNWIGEESAPSTKVWRVWSFYSYYKENTDLIEEKIKDGSVSPIIGDVVPIISDAEGKKYVDATVVDIKEGHHNNEIKVKFLDGTKSDWFAIANMDWGVWGNKITSGKYRPKMADYLDALKASKGKGGKNNFDGLVIFDEAHQLKNSAAVDMQGKVVAEGKGKSSEQGLAGMEMKKVLPNARFLNMSATGATIPRNLAYMPRLGIWGPGTPFPNGFVQFMGAMNQGGVGAMEMLTRDLKAIGSYISRSISYKGVEYDRDGLIHELTDAERKQYDNACDLWSEVLNKFDESIETTRRKKATKERSQFYGAMQRFFLQLMMTYQVKDVVADAKKQLAEGKSVIISLFNTNEGATEDAVKEGLLNGIDTEDIDVSPKHTLVNFIEKYFPIYQYHDVTDANGNTKPEMVTDESGNPIINREAQEVKEKLLEKVGNLYLPDAPFDALYNSFGTDNVAEISGRENRFVRGVGLIKRYGKKGDQKISKKQLNEYERKTFMDGTKRVLLLSGAGATGIDAHSALDAKNQERRVVYAYQLSWSADIQMQSFGRAHRSFQRVPPIIKLVQVNVAGQKRLVNTTSKRLASLGALATGSREAYAGSLFEIEDITDQYGERALETTYNELFQTDYGNLLKMGMLNKDGTALKSGKEDDVNNFLNRIMVLKVSDQNRIFDQFYQEYQNVVAQAKAAGVFDVGIQKLHARKIKLSQPPETVYIHEASGAKTQMVTLEGEVDVDRIKFDDMASRATSDSQGFWRNKKSGKISFLRKINTENSNYDEYLLVNTRGNHNTVQAENRAAFVEKYEELDDDKARELWDKEYESIPAVETRTYHMVTGAVYPIYDKLFREKMETRVIRANLEDGTSYIGIQIGQRDVAGVKQRLGIGTKIGKSNAKQIYDMVLGGSMIELDNGWVLKRSTVHGEERIELNLGDDFGNKTELEGYGLFEERIQYRNRWFVPMNDEDGPAAFEKIFKLHKPIRDQTAGEGGPQGAPGGKTPKGIRARNWGLKMPVEPQTDKRINKTQIIRYIEKTFGLPVLQRGLGKWKNAGMYYPKSVVIRLRTWGELEPLVHEVAHHVDRIMKKAAGTYWRTSGTQQQRQAINQELKDLDYDPTKKRTSEGFAEFVRHWATIGDEAQVAPEFTNFWESWLSKKENKKIRDQLMGLRDMLQTWYKQGRDARLDAQIDMHGEHVNFPGVGNKLKKARDWFVKHWSSTLDILGKVTKEAENLRGEELRPTKNPFEVATAYKKKGGMIAETFINKRAVDLHGNIVGKGLVEILRPIAGDNMTNVDELKPFIKYGVCKRALDLHAKGFETGIDPDDALSYVNDNQNPVWDKGLDEIREWSGHLLQWLVDAGSLDETAKKVIMDSNPIYLPFQRAFREEMAAQKLGGQGQGGSGVQRFKGSGRPILNPLESLMKSAQSIIMKAQKIHIARLVAEMSDIEAMGGVITRAGGVPMEAHRIDPEQVLQYLKSQGIETADMELNDFMTAFTQGYQYKGKDNIVAIWKNGKREFYELRPDVYEAITSIDMVRRSGIIRFLGAFARFRRLGAVGLKISFGVKNPARDVFTYVINSKNWSANPLDVVLALRNAILPKEGTIEWRYQHMGGKMSGAMGFDRAATMNAADEALSKLLSKRGKALRVVKRPDKFMRSAVNTLRDVFSILEVGPRGAELKKRYEHYKKSKPNWTDEDCFLKAFNDAQDVTINFTKSGDYGEQMNEVSAFFNVAYQEIDKIYRMAKEQPTMFVVKGLAYFTPLALACWYWNRNKDWWKNLEETYRWSNFFFEIGDNVYRIPFPFMHGTLFGALPMAIAERDPRGAETMIKLFAKQLPSFIVTALDPIWDVAWNKDYLGRPIESKSMQSRLSVNRSNYYTTETAKGISRVFNAFGVELSPIQIDYMLNSYSGGISKTYKVGKIRELADVPILTDFIVRAPEKPRRQMEYLFTTWDTLNKKKKDEKLSDLEMDEYRRLTNIKSIWENAYQYRIKRAQQKDDINAVKKLYSEFGHRMNAMGIK